MVWPFDFTVADATVNNSGRYFFMNHYSIINSICYVEYVKEEDFSRITDILKGNIVADQEIPNNREEFLATPPPKQLFYTYPANRVGILKTPGTSSKPKNVSFAPGNMHYSQEVTADSYNTNSNAIPLAEPITPLQVNESTFRGIPGRFPSPWVKPENNTTPDEAPTSNILPTNNSDNNAAASVDDMKILVNKISKQLLENNHQLNNLRKAAKKDLDKSDELKQQLAQCARLLTTALEERKEALKFAYSKDQECLILKAQLSEERRKNIKLMRVVLDGKGNSQGQSKEKVESESLDDSWVDHEKVLTAIQNLVRLSRDIRNRYGSNNKPILVITESLASTPKSSGLKKDYVDLKRTLQNQLTFLMKLPDSSQLTTFIQQVKKLISLLS